MLPPELTHAKREKAKHAFGVISEKLVADQDLRDALEVVFRWKFGQAEYDKNSKFSERLAGDPLKGFTQHAHDEGICTGWSEARDTLLDPETRRAELERIEAYEQELTQDE